MAEKKPPQGVQAQFEEEVYKLGIELIESYKKGTCVDKNATLEAIIKILDISKRG